MNPARELGPQARGYVLGARAVVRVEGPWESVVAACVGGGLVAGYTHDDIDLIARGTSRTPESRFRLARPSVVSVIAVNSVVSTVIAN